MTKDMKIFDEKDDIYNAISAFIHHGIVVVEGTKSSACEYLDLLCQELQNYDDDMSPIVGYQEVKNRGYLYYVFDSARYFIGDSTLKNTVKEIDAENPIW